MSEVVAERAAQAMAIDEDTAAASFSESDADDDDTEDDPVGDKRKKDLLLENMARIEREFADLRDRLYQEKLGQLNKELELLNSDEHPDFQKQAAMLERKKTDRLTTIELYRKLQLENIQHQHAFEKREIENEYQTKRGEIRDDILGSLQDKRKKLEEDKNAMDLASELETRAMATRKLRRRVEAVKEPGVTQIEKKRKNATATGPPIVHLLDDGEINDDLNAIRRVTQKNHAGGNPGALPPGMAGPPTVMGQQHPGMMFMGYPPGGMGMPMGAHPGMPMGMPGAGPGGVGGAVLPPGVGVPVGAPPGMGYGMNPAQAMPPAGMMGGRRKDGAFGPGSKQGEVEVYVANNQLVVNEEPFEKGQVIWVDPRDNTEVYSGVIASITQQEIWVRRPDNTKSKIYLNLLRTGRCAIQRG
ncbi:hypothetical protein CAOG_02996 [Capsaspora owczarzaki ATCC 30864]|uniref:Uncharacterized protein n=1 Tax=Capsaspora owczarzaki (strain ATCC 30864) TaxID=595528 RepID=A0A0D2WMC2_CAPO3|nr:hypothetical protein CAOG_02996 [Capsaspora owczarzaki ATCC 30864]KJE91950.1 hypothetical protein, variant [Capsaspora owczarzaki ATCC 30864]|eukprot:XP_004363835.1 hypothetical protein CAOG_02996 [Capsaspora owczarzaki ATCC 30864]